MPHRTNIVLDDKIWNLMQEVPKGSRSEIVNQALNHWFRLQKRMTVVEQMDALRERIDPVSGQDLVSYIRADRDRSRSSCRMRSLGARKE